MSVSEFINRVKHPPATPTQLSDFAEKERQTA